MVLVSIVEAAESDWQVWAQLEDEDPREQPNSLIVGLGTSRDAAVADAVSALEETIEALQGHPSTLPEYGPTASEGAADETREPAPEDKEREK
jgi:hypothetical protein